MDQGEHIQLAHGGGGQLTAELLEELILPALGGGQQPGRLADAAVLSVGDGRLAFTTDTDWKVAKDRFVDKYRTDPDYIFSRDNLLLLGPIPNE